MLSKVKRKFWQQNSSVVLVNKKIGRAIDLFLSSRELFAFRGCLETTLMVTNCKS